MQTIKQQLELVRDALEEFAQGKRGSCEIAGDPTHLFRLLGQKPGALKIAILFRSETKRGEFEESGMVDRRFLVIVSCGRGFALQRGAASIRGVAGGDPLFDMAEAVRNLVRGVQFAGAGATEVTPDYKGMSLFQFPADTSVDAYKLEFSIGTQLQAPA